MKTKNQVPRFFTTLVETKWLQPTMLSLAIALVLLGIAGCQAPHH